NKLYRGNRSHQYLYINKRNIKNYDISKAIESKYKSLIPLNRFPIFVLDIELDPKELDINIHPTKQEIKFIDKDRVIKSIINVINYNLFSNIDIPNIKFKKEKKVTKEEVPKLFELSQESKQSNSPKDFIIKDFIVTDFTNIKPTDNLKKEDMYIKKNTENPNNKQSNNKQRKQIQNKVTKKTNEEQKIRDYLLDIFPIGKIFNTYIIAESKTDEKVFFIDQHAAHERIMYEKYKKE